MDENTAVNWVEPDDAPDAADQAAWHNYRTAVDAELERLKGMSQQQKRRNTIWHMAWAEVTTGASAKQVLQRSDCVSKATYYHQEKDWYHNDLFREVLANVIELTRYYIETKNARRLAYREQQVREMEYGASMKLAEKVEQMLKFAVEQIVEETEEIEDGRRVIRRVVEPADWKFRDIAPLIDTASKLGRRALDMDSARIRTTDWHDEVLELLRRGEIEPADVVAELGDAMARDFFAQAGIEVDE